MLKKHVDGAWCEFSGTETVVRHDLASLTDGQDIVIAASQREVKPDADSSTGRNTPRNREPQAVNKTASLSPSD